jgi:Cu+-exporting ATPase
MAAGAEIGSEHPLGEAIVQRAHELEPVLPFAEAFESVTGKGIRARIEGREIVLGNRALMDQAGVSTEALDLEADRLARGGTTPMYVAVDGRAAGLVAVADTLKPESRDAVEQLQALGLEVWMLTGDNRATAETIARQVGSTGSWPRCCPTRRQTRSASFRRQGRPWRWSATGSTTRRRSASASASTPTWSVSRSSPGCSAQYACALHYNPAPRSYRDKGRGCGSSRRK